MKTEAYVIDNDVLIVREDEPHDDREMVEAAPTTSQVNLDDPRLVEEIQTINPDADAYSLVTTLSIG